MKPSLTDAMVEAMDDMGGLHLQHKPAAPQSAFFWRGSPSAIGASLKPSNKDRSKAATNARYSYPVEGREAGEKSANKRHALIRGGI